MDGDFQFYVGCDNYKKKEKKRTRKGVGMVRMLNGLNGVVSVWNRKRYK